MTFPTVTVQVAFDKRVTEAATDVDFTTVTDANPVRQFVIKRGKANVLDTIQAGTAVMIFDDANGNLDPENTSSPYYASGKTKVLPMRHLRIVAVDPATTTSHILFWGFIEGWESNYGKSGLDQVAKCTAVDSFKTYSLAKGPFGVAGAGVLRAEEGSGDRVEYLMGLTAEDTSTADVVEADDLNVAAKTYTADMSMLTEMQAIDTAEVGFFYVSRSNVTTFKNRGSRVAQFSDKQGTFTDGSTVPADTFSYDFVEFSRDDEQIINRADSVIHGGAAGTTANDTDSQDDYGIRSLTNSDLMLTTKPAATVWNDYAISRLANPEARVRSIQWIQGADANDDRWAPLLAGDLGELYQVDRTTPAGTAITALVLTEQITHQVKAGKWTTSWALSSADDEVYWVLDDGSGTYADWSELGVTTRLFFG